MGTHMMVADLESLGEGSVPGFWGENYPSGKNGHLNIYEMNLKADTTDSVVGSVLAEAEQEYGCYGGVGVITKTYNPQDGVWVVDDVVRHLLLTEVAPAVGVPEAQESWDAFTTVLMEQGTVVVCLGSGLWNVTYYPYIGGTTAEGVRYCECLRFHRVNEDGVEKTYDRCSVTFMGLKDVLDWVLKFDDSKGIFGLDTGMEDKPEGTCVYQGETVHIQDGAVGGFLESIVQHAQGKGLPDCFGVSLMERVNVDWVTNTQACERILTELVQGYGYTPVPYDEDEVFWTLFYTIRNHQRVIVDLPSGVWELKIHTQVNAPEKLVGGETKNHYHKVLEFTRINH